MASVPRASSGTACDVASFWVEPRGRSGPAGSVASRRSFFIQLVARVNRSPGIILFDAVEEGVPTYLVDVIADATRQPASFVMDVIGVSPTTFRRKTEAKEPLPDVAGHRVMGFLRIAATLRRLLDESGDPDAVKGFDLEGWLANWMIQPLPELGAKTPAAMLRNPEGLRAVEQVLERMRGGLAA